MLRIPVLCITAILIGIVGWNADRWFGSHGDQPRGGTAPGVAVRLVSVTDGDSLTVLKDGKPFKVRLASIEAPEHDQRFAGGAKAALKAMTEDVSLRLLPGPVNDAGATEGRLFADGEDVAMHLVTQGWAWHSRPDAGLESAESVARRERRGLWADKDPVPPWLWREGRGQPVKRS